VDTLCRVMVSNRLARSGKEWTKLFEKFNSGTYNNQWMVLDYNKASCYNSMSYCLTITT
jgi:hypothetical protein